MGLQGGCGGVLSMAIRANEALGEGGFKGEEWEVLVWA